MQSIRETALIENLKKEDSSAFERLYTICFPSVLRYVRQNNGADEEAKDIFQETIIVLLRKVREPDFMLTASLNTYVFAISKNLWQKKLRERKTLLKNIHVLHKDYLNTDNNSEEEIETISKIQTWLRRITENCQRILRGIFFLDEPMEELIKKMGWKNKHTAANQKYKCLEQVKRESKK